MRVSPDRLQQGGPNLSCRRRHRKYFSVSQYRPMLRVPDDEFTKCL
jgi:hypothetical protein